jgi:uncharacterized protein
MQIFDLVSLRFYKEAIINLCNKYHASNVQVFGSVARNEATEKSDIDLLVDFPLYTSALDYVALQRELTNLLQRKVDLIIADSIHPYLKEKILKEAIKL